MWTATRQFTGLLFVDQWRFGRTESITVSDLCPPAANQVYFVLRHRSDTRVPTTNQLHVFVYLVRLDLMEDNAVYVFSTSQDLTETLFNLLVHFATFWRPIDETAQATLGLLLG